MIPEIKVIRRSDGKVVANIDMGAVVLALVAVVLVVLAWRALTKKK